jgi:hypothetical protein
MAAMNCITPLRRLQFTESIGCGGDKEGDATIAVVNCKTPLRRLQFTEGGWGGDGRGDATEAAC